MFERTSALHFLGKKPRCIIENAFDPLPLVSEVQIDIIVLRICYEIIACSQPADYTVPQSTADIEISKYFLTVPYRRLAGIFAEMKIA